jgi:hypothetical protein
MKEQEMKKRLVLLLAGAFFLMVTSAIALPINDRATVLDPGPGDGTEDSVQAILTTLTGGTIDAVAGQSNVALWNPAELDSSAYKITYWTGNTGSFGIYSALTGEKVNLFSKTTSTPINPTSGQKADFDILADGTLYANSNFYSGFGSTFGFYWNDGFTEDSKNGDKIMALVYNLPDLTPLDMPFPWSDSVSSGGNDWVIAFGDQGGVSDDFNDLVVLVEDINPVPEPGTLLLLGSGLIGLAFLKRRKQA